jgi:hypothetical protein
MERVVLAISPHTVEDAGDSRLLAIHGINAINHSLRRVPSMDQRANDIPHALMASEFVLGSTSLLSSEVHCRLATSNPCGPLIP